MKPELPKLKLPKLKKTEGNNQPKLPKKEGYIEKDKRKKILLLCDDIRVHSGVATVAREMVLNTCHRYNWVQIAGAVQHPESGKKIDISEDSNNHPISTEKYYLYSGDILDFSYSNQFKGSGFTGTLNFIETYYSETTT